jgi:hypothetical protein
VVVVVIGGRQSWVRWRLGFVGSGQIDLNGREGVKHDPA